MEVNGKMPRITAIFLYGQFRDIVKGEAIIFKDTIVKGFKIPTGFPVAIIGNKEDTIVGNLIDFTNKKKLEDQLEQLDIIFELNKENPKYTREVVDVDIFGKKTKKAWMYISKIEVK